MKFILASASPRRKYLLEETDSAFDIQPLNIDETFSDDIANDKVALFLAREKGKAALEKFGTDPLILSADSVVLLEHQVLGKPGNYDASMAMLNELSGKSHEVHTGFHLSYKGKVHAETVISKVSFDEISEKEAQYYVTKYKPYDKAGSYGIQEWIGHNKINRIEGSYTNIVGLPMREVYRAIQEITA
jgi:septum formation protein